MINLAANGIACECGSTRLAPEGVRQGELCICAACARVFAASVTLTPARWSEVERAFAEHRPYDLMAFEWTRNGVHPSRRETLPELPLPRARRFRAAERSGTALGLAFALVIVLVLARAVFS